MTIEVPSFEQGTLVLFAEGPPYRATVSTPKAMFPLDSRKPADEVSRIWAFRYERSPPELGFAPGPLATSSVAVTFGHRFAAPDTAQVYTLNSRERGEWRLPEEDELRSRMEELWFVSAAERCATAGGCYATETDYQQGVCTIPCAEPEIRAPIPPDLPQLAYGAVLAGSTVEKLPTGVEGLEAEFSRFAIPSTCDLGQMPGLGGCRPIADHPCPIDGEWPNVEATTGNKVYVRAEGAAGGAGTEALPFGTLQEALDAAVSGDTIILGRGVHRGNWLIEKPDLRLVGVCPDMTVLEAVVVLATLKVSAPLVVRDLSVTHTSNLAVFVSPSASLDARGVAFRSGSGEALQVWSERLSTIEGLVEADGTGLVVGGFASFQGAAISNRYSAAFTYGTSIFSSISIGEPTVFVSPRALLLLGSARVSNAAVFAPGVLARGSSTLEHVGFAEGLLVRDGAELQAEHLSIDRGQLSFSNAKGTLRNVTIESAGGIGISLSDSDVSFDGLVVSRSVGVGVDLIDSNLSLVDAIVVDTQHALPETPDDASVRLTNSSLSLTRTLIAKSSGHGINQGINSTLGAKHLSILDSGMDGISSTGPSSLSLDFVDIRGASRGLSINRPVGSSGDRASDIHVQDTAYGIYLWYSELTLDAARIEEGSTGIYANGPLLGTNISISMGGGSGEPINNCLRSSALWANWEGGSIALDAFELRDNPCALTCLDDPHGSLKLRHGVIANNRTALDLPRFELPELMQGVRYTGNSLIWPPPEEDRPF